MVRRTFDPHTALAAILTAGLLFGACKSSNGQRATDDEETAGDSEPASESADASDGPSTQARFNQGNTHLDAGEWEAAIGKYREALERDSENWKIHLNLAIAQSKVKQFDEAVASVRRALENGGAEEPRVYYNLGNIYQERGLYEQALRAYRTSLAHRDDPDVDTLINIGSTLTILDRLEAARETYRRAAELAPNDPRIRHGRAAILVLDGDYREATDAYAQLHRSAPEYAPAYFDHSVPYVRLDEYEEAIRVLRKYLEVAPDGHYAGRAKALIETYQEKLERGSAGTDSTLH